MLNKLKELVFGLDEFEKTKIDVRYELITSMVSTLRLNEISDFEILEDCISKIKDQLRVKSSNLNKVISDPSKKLKKKDVFEVLDRLGKVKYDFLEKAFNLIKKDNSAFDELKSHAQELDSKIDNLQEQNISSPIVEDYKIVHLDDYVKVKISNGKVPYLIVDFVHNTDYNILKKLSGYLFEEYSAMGTNIIIDKNKAIIVPRFDNDNLFDIPRIDIDIDDVFKRIKEEDVSGTQHANQAIPDKEGNGHFEETKKPEYIEIDKKPLDLKTKKFEEDSLDAILMGTEKERITPRPNPQDDDNTFAFEKEDAIEFEKKEEDIKEPEVEIERKETRDKGIEDVDTDSKLQSPRSNSKKYEVYRDENIVVYLKDDSKVLGELVIEPLSGDIVESDYTYMWIFSKIFSSVLFEETHSAGTNILMDYSNNKVRIIPRMQDDNLDILWTPKQESDEFLEQIRGKLLKILDSALEGNKTEITDSHKVAENKKESKDEDKDEDKETRTEGMSSKEKKAIHLLEHLRKIP